MPVSQGTGRETATEPASVRLAYLVPPSPNFAGVERVVHEIATGLTESYGDVLDVHVFFATRYDDELLKNTSYTLHVLHVDRLRSMGSSLRSQVAEHQIDILVCAQVEPSVVAWLATRGLDLPVFVSHLHGNPQLEEHNGSLRTRLAFSMFRHIVSRRISGILAISPSLQRYTARSVTHHAPVLFAKNPARLLNDENARRDPSDVFRLLNVGRLSQQKGQDVLLRALAIARPQLRSVSLTIVGTGPDESSLRKLSDELNISDIVNFVGYTSDPSNYFGSTDCFVLSSRWEGFPLVLLEALRFGLPVVAADCNFGPSDLITDSRIGEPVQVDDVAALAAGILSAAASEPDSAAEEYRRSVAQGYSRHEATKTHLEALQQLVARDSMCNERLIRLTTTAP